MKFKDWMQERRSCRRPPCLHRNPHPPIFLNLSLSFEVKHLPGGQIMPPPRPPLGQGPLGKNSPMGCACFSQSPPTRSHAPCRVPCPWRHCCRGAAPAPPASAAVSSPIASSPSSSSWPSSCCCCHCRYNCCCCHPLLQRSRRRRVSLPFGCRLTNTPGRHC
jgi:hypothetical protein